jgi:hypothetical protein
MTKIKTFALGALLGTLLGATFLGAISHLLIIGLAVVGAGALVLARRRGLPPGSGGKALKRLH